MFSSHHHMLSHTTSTVLHERVGWAELQKIGPVQHLFIRYYLSFWVRYTNVQYRYTVYV